MDVLQRLSTAMELSSDDAPEKIARDVLAVKQIESIPTLLEVICAITGMRFAAVARVTDGTWTACAVKDEINFGLQAGGQLSVETIPMHRVEKNTSPDRHRACKPGPELY